MFNFITKIKSIWSIILSVNLSNPLFSPADYFMEDIVENDNSEAKDNKEQVQSEEVPSVPQEEPEDNSPTKSVQTTKILSVNATISFIDFEGKTDGATLNKILTEMQPRRLVLVRGNFEDEEIAKQITQYSEGQVFVASRGKVLDVSEETRVFQVCIVFYLKDENSITLDVLF